MPNKAQDISAYTFKINETLLLDANIWLLIYGPQKPNDKRVDVYSRAFNKILQAQSVLYIDVLIVSEFINTYSRLIYNQTYSSNHTNFKSFRKSNDFKTIANDISGIVKQILKHCTRLESGFSTLTIDSLLDEYALGSSDFNDQVLANLCQDKGLKLITDDGDYKGLIPVVTANKKLLS